MHTQLVFSVFIPTFFHSNFIKLLPDRQFGTEYMAFLMAQSGYDAIGISVADFYEGPAPLSAYMTRLIAQSGGSSPAPTFLASKCAHLIHFSSLPLNFLVSERTHSLTL